MQRGWGIIQLGKQGMHPPLASQPTAAFLASEEQNTGQKTAAGKAQELNLLLMFTFTEASVSH